jgi:hypothetical protein
VRHGEGRQKQIEFTKKTENYTTPVTPTAATAPAAATRKKWGRGQNRLRSFVKQEQPDEEKGKEGKHTKNECQKKDVFAFSYSRGGSIKTAVTPQKKATKVAMECGLQQRK